MEPEQLISNKSPVAPPKSGSWGWKLATTIEDALNFLNGTGMYKIPVVQARICAIWAVNHPEFYIYYQRAKKSGKGNWGWKLATTADDVRNFLNGAGVYEHPVKEAQIASYNKGNHNEFYVFYQRSAAGEQVLGNWGWGWKLATDPMDVIHFLNGEASYRHPVTTTRIALVNEGAYEAFYIFYQMAVKGLSVPNWYWKLATTPEDAHHFINGTEGYSQAVKDFEIAMLHTDTYNRFYVFANQGKAD